MEQPSSLYQIGAVFKLFLNHLLKPISFLWLLIHCEFMVVILWVALCFYVVVCSAMLAVFKCSI